MNNDRKDIRISIPAPAAKVIVRLHELGYEACIVGGCVRDSLLGLTPEDWDITTSATPEQVREAFSRTFDTGAAHGTVTVRMDGESLEVTTYRIDGAYGDHRHPDEVHFTSSLEEDLKRRDFTINAMAYNDRDGLIDLFHGVEDLSGGIVRCVGNADERFTEDALRIFRAVRFCAKLGFSMAPETKDAAKRLSPSLSLVSAERIRMELEKLLVSPHPELIRLAWECGITKVVLPEFDAMMNAVQNNAHHKVTVGEHTIRTLCACPPERILRLVMLLHDSGKPACQTIDEKGIFHYHGHAEPGARIAEKVCERLKFDKTTIRTVVHLIRNHSLYPELTQEGVRRAVVRLGEDLFPLFLQVKRADIGGQNPEVQEKKFRYMDEVEHIYEGILARGDCLNLKNLKITGNDLISAGIPRGILLGRILNELLDEVLSDPSLNRREALLERAGALAGDFEEEEKQLKQKEKEQLTKGIAAC